MDEYNPKENHFVWTQIKINEIFQLQQKTIKQQSKYLEEEEVDEDDNNKSVKLKRRIRSSSLKK